MWSYHDIIQKASLIQHETLPKIFIKCDFCPVPYTFLAFLNWSTGILGYGMLAQVFGSIRWYDHLAFNTIDNLSSKSKNFCLIIRILIIIMYTLLFDTYAYIPKLIGASNFLLHQKKFRKKNVHPKTLSNKQ